MRRVGSTGTKALCCATVGTKAYVAPKPDYDAKSLLLKTGMSEQEVKGVLGTPKKAEVHTCGSNTDKPWTCKIWTYGFFLSGMGLLFEEAGADDWRLNSWSVGVGF
jgi:hypothetical protein